MAADETPTTPGLETPQRRLGRMIGGFHTTQLITTAARLGLADRLRNGVRSAQELAPAVGAHAPSLHRLMRALVEIGVLEDAGEGRFGLTELGRLLQEDAPGSMRSVALVYGGEFYQAWASLLESMRTGETAFDRVFGAPFFDYYARHPEEGEAFDRTMASLSAAMGDGVVAAYDFSGMGTLVDVGGGKGGLLTAVLKANPTLSGILFDQPAVIEGAREQIGAAGLSERCRLVGGDFFAAVPEGGDAYLLKWILHDWDDERSIRILRSCRRAMGEQARLLIMEVVLPDRMPPQPVGAAIDVHMLALTGGRERTESEYRALLAAGGFQLTRIVPTDARSQIFGTAVSIIEGVPVQTP
jgi:hypothetical protein